LLCATAQLAGGEDAALLIDLRVVLRIGRDLVVRDVDLEEDQAVHGLPLVDDLECHLAGHGRQLLASRS
jgi:hypothetical protein